jgi:hypothetical protein
MWRTLRCKETTSYADQQAHYYLVKFYLKDLFIPFS